MELLLENGAHIDQRNANGQRPTYMLKLIPGCKINVLRFTDLKCLAAATVSKHAIAYRDEVPRMLEDFIESH